MKNFIQDVRQELRKVRFPKKDEMVKYSTIAISFILFFAAFFSLSDFIIAGIKTLVK